MDTEVEKILSQFKSLNLKSFQKDSFSYTHTQQNHIYIQNREDISCNIVQASTVICNQEVDAQ